MSDGMDLCGFLVLDKPTGLTSREAVNCVGSLLGRKVRVGHAGTLDPLATGVLVVAVGQATRLIEYVQQMSKTYKATVRLGGRSDTDDSEGVVTSVNHSEMPPLEQVVAAIDRQIGTILQMPPQFSALKVAGRRAYDLARAGATVDLQPRPVRIDQIEVHSYRWPELEIEVGCGSGTYIRAIARDLGETLGCGGYLTALRRTGIGSFLVENAVDPLKLSREDIVKHLISPRAAVESLPTVLLDEIQVAMVRQGRVLDPSRLAGTLNQDYCREVALLDPSGALIAIARLEAESGGGLAPHRVLAGPPT